MPRIERDRIPAALMAHLVRRVREREISTLQLELAGTCILGKAWSCHFSLKRVAGVTSLRCSYLCFASPDSWL